MDKQVVVLLYNEMLFLSNKKEQTAEKCNTDESQIHERILSERIQTQEA